MKILDICLNCEEDSFYKIDDDIMGLNIKSSTKNLNFINKIIKDVDKIKINFFKEFNHNNINQIKYIFSFNKKVIFDSENISDLKIKELKKELNTSFYVKSKYNPYEDVLVDDYLETIEIMDNMKKEIEYYNLSPLEKIIYIYDMVKEKIYKKSSSSVSHSRDLTKVLQEEEIVCMGYANIFSSLANFLGLNTCVKCYYNEEKNSGHATVTIYLNDLKYDVHGVFECDPTWDSKKYYDDKDFINNYKWCMNSYILGDKQKQLINIYSTETKGILNDINQQINRIKQISKLVTSETILTSFYNSFYLKASRLYNLIGLYEKEQEIINFKGNCNLDLVDKIYEELLTYYNINLDYEIFLKALYQARRIEYLNNPLVRKLSYDEIESSLDTKYGIKDSKRRLYYFIKYGSFESVLFGEDDDEIIDDDNYYTKMDEDIMKLNFLYQIKTILKNKITDTTNKENEVVRIKK